MLILEQEALLLWYPSKLSLYDGFSVLSKNYALRFVPAGLRYNPWVTDLPRFSPYPVAVNRIAFIVAFHQSTFRRPSLFSSSTIWQINL